MANKEQLEILNNGVRSWNEWRVKNNLVIDLSDASLSGINLGSGDMFNHIDLHYANLARADLATANLGGAILVNATLTGANLGGANLSGANLWGADLDNADLSETQLYDTDFSESSLSRADFTGAVMDGTIFAGVDFTGTKGLESVRHEGPSRIGIDTIYLSNGKLPDDFVRGVGLPDSFAVYMKSLVVEPVQYYSCFISYSRKDQRLPA